MYKKAIAIGLVLLFFTSFPPKDVLHSKCDRTNYMCAIMRLQEDKRELLRLQAEWDAQNSLPTQESAR